MKNNLVKIVDSIPTPTAEQGDRAVNLMLAFVAGFVFAILVFGQ